MAEIFNLEAVKIAVLNLDELGKKSIDGNIECLCTISTMNGSAGCLLQIYIIKIDFNLFIEKLKQISSLYKDEFYVPYDNFNGYYKISPKSGFSKVLFDEERSNDEYVYFLDAKDI